MKANGQTAQFLWISGALSPLEQLSLRSFVDHGYTVHLYTYGEVTGVPPGVSLKDACDILPRSRIYTFEAEGFGKGSYAGFADLFRYHLLYKKGGWWFDTDCISIRPLPCPSDLWICSSFEGCWGTVANSCAIYAPPGHPILARLCEESTRIIAGENFGGFGATGPYLLHRIVAEYHLQAHVAPWWEFTPYPQKQIHLAVFRGNRAWIKNSLRRVKFFVWQCLRRDFRAGYIRPGTRALHLFNEIWRAANIDKHARFHPRCLFERLKRRHGVVTPAR